MDRISSMVGVLTKRVNRGYGESRDTERLHLRLTSGYPERIRHRAAEQNLSISAYIEQLVDRDRGAYGKDESQDAAAYKKRG